MTFFRLFRKNRLAVIGLAFLIVLVFVAIFADLIAPYGYRETGTAYQAPPSWDHLFGTDQIGRDMFSRVIYGSRVSLKIGFLATGLMIVIGVVYGAVAGFFGGALDTMMMRFTDIFLSIPYVVLAVAIASVFGRTENAIILVLGLTGWMPLSRVVRSSYLSLKKQEFAEAAKALGFGRTRIIFGHLLPNAMQPIIVYGTLSVGGAILAEAALSFIGVGPQPPSPAWGLAVAENKGFLASASHMLFFPGFAIFFTVLAFVFIGDGLRDALDPKMKA